MTERKGLPTHPAAVAALLAQLRVLGLTYTESSDDLTEGHADFLVAPNAQGLAAYGCADAAAKRVRQGIQGVPLADELKTWLGRFSRRDGGLLVMLHARGDQRFDLDKVGEFFGARNQPTWADVNELPAFTVNPITGVIYDRSHPNDRIFQLIEPDLTQNRSGTMTTNAGDDHWTLEFRPDRLFQTLATVLPERCDFLAGLGVAHAKKGSVGGSSATGLAGSIGSGDRLAAETRAVRSA
jgi:hypothetical protein